MAETGERATILIVDDSPENIRILRNLLKDAARLLFATSGAQALATARAELPDLILLDVVMPGMDGYEVCRTLKQDPALRDVPVIFITGLSDETDESRGLEAGAIDYITKPFSAPIVHMRVNNQLALRRMTRDLLRANAELTRLATTDALTGASNRRHFMAEVARELPRMRRYHHPSAMFMLDIDHFKRLNDSYGHHIGDLALIATAEVLREMLRAHDQFGRLGGEEFGGFLPETELDAAVMVCERLRERLALITVETPQGAACFTGSIGVVPVTPADETVELALKRADQAMYAAKTGGRNRVVVR